MDGNNSGITRVKLEAVPRLNFQNVTKLNSSVDSKAASDESVTVAVSDSASISSSAVDTRTKLNQVINTVNITSQAADSIRKLVGSIDGIIKQVSDGKAPSNRVAVLEDEANSLVNEIKKIANNTALDGVRPLSGDKLTLQVREDLGKQLDLVFPNDAKDAFGIGEISFSRKEAILDTRAKIEVAWKRLEELKTAVNNNHEALQETAGSLEVAMQNAKAAEASPHDLDTAMELAKDTSLSISTNPDNALGSVNKLPATAAVLLE